MIPSVDLGRYELRRFARSRLTRAAIAALVMIPLLYAGLYLWSFWDPQGHLNQLPAALVDEDRPVTVDGETVTAGADLTRKLLDRDIFDWAQVSSQEAEAGVRDGRYYLALTIPADFSAKLSSPSGTGQVDPAYLDIHLDQGRSYIVETIAKAVFAEVKSTLEQTTISEYLDKIFVSFDELKKKTGEAADGAAKLADGSGTAEDGAVQLGDGLGTASQGVRKLGDGLGSAQDGAGQLSTGLGSARNGAGQLTDGLGTARQGTSTLAGGLGTAEQGAGELTTGLGSARDGAGQLTTGLGSAQSGADRLTDGLGTARQGTGTLAGGLGTAAQGMGTLTQGLGSAEQGAGKLTEGLVKLDRGAATLAAGNGEVYRQIHQYASTVNEAADVAVPFLNKHAPEIRRIAQVVALIAKWSAECLEELPDEVRQAAERTQKVARDLEKWAREHPGQDPVGLINDAVKVMEEVAELAARLADYTDTRRAEIENLAELAREIATIATAVADAAPTLGAKLDAARDKFNQLDTGLGKLAAGSAELHKGTGQALQGATSLVGGLGKLEGGAVKLHDGLGKLEEGAVKLDGGLLKLLTGAGSLDAGLGKLEGGAVKLDDGLGRLEGGAVKLDDGLGQLAGGATRLDDGLGQLVGGADKLDIGLGQLAGGATRLDDGLGRLAGGADELDDGLGQLTDGATRLDAGLVKLTDGAKELSNGLADGYRQIPGYSDEERAQRVGMMSEPVRLNTRVDNPVPNYGTGFAPFFLPLSLWVGAMVTYMLLRPLNPRVLAGAAPAWRAALAGWLPAASLGVLQVGVLAAVLRFALGLEAAHWGLLIGLLVLTSAAFIAIVQALNAYFGAVGKILALLMLMLQLTSAGGTYPIETSPGFFRDIAPWLPMSWVVSALRRLISGGDLTPVWHAGGVLAAFAVGALALTTLAARRDRLWKMDRLHPQLAL